MFHNRLVKKIADVRDKVLIKEDILLDFIFSRLGVGFKTQKTVLAKHKIGIVVLAHNRPEYLKPCLDSLFRTKLYDYDVTFLIHDDGSTDPEVKKIINRNYDSKYKIVRVFNEKGPNSWGAAFNRAVKHLLTLNDFEIIGSCDSDAYFHPEWLDKTIKIGLWAKQNHKNNILGPFSSFNSSDVKFHKIIGHFTSPYGGYVVKERMGALNYFYFKKDFLKLGFFPENKDDETQMTEKFKKLRVRNFCTEVSYIEHIGQYSILNKWRPKAVDNAVYGLNPAPGQWLRKLKNYNLESVCTPTGISTQEDRSQSLISKIRFKLGLFFGVAKIRGYKKLKKVHDQSGAEVVCGLRGYIPSKVKLDIIIPAIDKDSEILPYVINSARKNLLHPIGKIFIIAPKNTKIEKICLENDCCFVDENSILPLKREDIDYIVNGRDRSGWLLQQILKLAADQISDQDNFLILDADTVFIHRQAFEENEKIIFDVSDEYHQSYFETFEKLTGIIPTLPFSFVSHHMLFNRNILKEFKVDIGKRFKTEWYKAIIVCTDFSTPSGFSEYETYANYCFKNHKDKMILEYWHNFSLQKKKIGELDKLLKKYKNKYKTLSFHDYN